jgi:hypothetical protein
MYRFFASFFLLCAGCFHTLHAKDLIRIVPAKEFPEPESVQLKIVFPKSEQDFNKKPIYSQFSLRGFSLGSDTPQTRNVEVSSTPLGQTVHVIVDEEPYFPYNGPSFDPFDEDGGNFYQSNYRMRLKENLNEGMHTIRVLACRSWGECLKGDQVFDARVFFIGDQNCRPVHLHMPYLTYNEPSNQLELLEGRPILLDFYLSNCELSKDGYKVRVEIDGKKEATLVQWRPYYIYGLSKGKHEIRLTLIDGRGKEVFGPFNDVRRILYVE